MAGKSQELLRLKVRLNGQLFEAEGSSPIVIEQLHYFLALAQTCLREQFPSAREQVSGMETVTASSPRPTLPNTTDEERSLKKALDKIIREDPQHSALICTIHPRTSHASRDTAMILLLGHHLLHQHAPTPVLALARSLKQSGHSVARVDRLLREPLKNHWVLKSGTGKGGKYQLTKSGWIQARDLALEFARLLP